MPSSSNQARTSALEGRLTAAEQRRILLHPDFDFHKMKFNLEKSNVFRLRLKLAEAQQKAQTARKNNQLYAHDYHVKAVDELNKQIASSVREMESLAASIRTEAEDIRNQDMEILTIRNLIRESRGN